MKGVRLFSKPLSAIRSVLGGASCAAAAGGATVTARLAHSNARVTRPNMSTLTDQLVMTEIACRM